MKKFLTTDTHRHSRNCFHKKSWDLGPARFLMEGLVGMRGIFYG